MVHCRKPTLARCTICRQQTSRQQEDLTHPQHLTHNSFLPVLCLLLLLARRPQPGKISMPLVLIVQTPSLITCTEVLRGPRLRCKPSPRDAAASLVSWQTHSRPQQEHSSRQVQPPFRVRARHARQDMAILVQCWLHHKMVLGPPHRASQLKEHSSRQCQADHHALQNSLLPKLKRVKTAPPDRLYNSCRAF